MIIIIIDILISIGFINYLFPNIPFLKTYSLIKYLNWSDNSFIAEYIFRERYWPWKWFDAQQNNLKRRILDRCYCCIHQLSHGSNTKLLFSIYNRKQSVHYLVIMIINTYQHTNTKKIQYNVSKNNSIFID